MTHSANQLYYTLQLADTALILGHRISEWCGHGPVLEQDIALANTALDHLGTARSLYQYAAMQYNHLPQAEKETVFTSPALLAVSGEANEDDIAYLRDSWDFRNVLLAEQPNEDWAYTIARSFFLDAFHYYYFSALQNSPDELLAAVAEKSLKEATYQLKWSSEWMIRLGDGTEESAARMQRALNDRWAFTGELFAPSEAEKAMQAAGVAPDLSAIKAQWQARVMSVTEQAMLHLPEQTWMQSGGKESRHTERLGYILAEMQYLQRTYPGMDW